MRRLIGSESIAFWQQGQRIQLQQKPDSFLRTASQVLNF